MKWKILRVIPVVPIIFGLLFLHPGATQVRAVTFPDFNEIQDRILDGTADLELNPNSQQAQQHQAQPSTYSPRGSDSCAANNSSNIKVNQACLNVSDPDLAGRGQAQNETTIAQDPNNVNHIVGAFNNYQRGDGNCIGDYSLDKGRTWNDTSLPTSFTRGAQFNAARQYWQAGGDPSVAWDTKGNVYFTCQVFQRGGAGVTSNPDLSSGVYVYRSTQNDGASWNFPGRPVIESSDVTGSGVSPFEDKPYMTVDNNLTACSSSQTAVAPGSSCTPFQDRIYVVYTEFAADGSAYLWESYSSDYGEHFSPRHLVSVTSPLCTLTYGAGTPNGSCNENQFANPFVGPDGTLYVVFQNFNNTTRAPDNRNQILLVKSLDGGNTFSPPVKVSDYYDFPDCATYQGGKDLGRGCMPEKGASMNSFFRGVNYPTGSVNPTKPLEVVVTFGSYINKFSNESNGCAPAGFNPVTGYNLYTGVKTPGACNNKILESVSNDGGATFTGTATDPRVETTVNQAPGQAGTDQWWQWQGFTKNGKFAVSYYDRQYNTDETTGYMDVSLSGSGDLTNFVVNRVTSGSMPPPTQFGGLFLGDYTGLTVADNAYPLWMDTRNPELFTGPACGSSGPPTICTGTYADSGLMANDQDAYVASLPVPAK